MRLRFDLESVADAELPPYQGSLLRGAFGHALRELACPMDNRQACDACPLRFGCAYVRLFEGPGGGESTAFVDGEPTSPRPFIFEPRTTRCRFQRGDVLSFDLLLLGDAAELQAYAVTAVDRMARRGLGVRRHPFRLGRASALGADGRWRVGFEPGGPSWTQVEAVRCLPDRPLDRDRLRLRFLTPLLLKRRGKILGRLDLATLMERMARRVLGVAEVHGDGEPTSTIETWRRRAADVQVWNQDLRWYDWHRYSHRQRQKVPLGGLVGEMEIAGKLEPLHPLLRAAELLHVGKGTPLGLGWVAVS